MTLRFLHLSDLHFAEDINSPEFSDDQLYALGQVYRAESAKKKFDRVIVTGDLTVDHNPNSFGRAKGFLVKQVMDRKGNMMGLDMGENDVTLKVVPGNRDFDWEKLNSKNHFAGLEDYNKYFKGNHLFESWKPIVFDWFPGDTGPGVFIAYINSSILGMDDHHLGVKKNYLKYICDALRIMFNNGLNDKLKEKANGSKTIDGEAFRKSVKILVSHHPLLSNKNISFLDPDDRRKFLTNLGVMDFQIQLSGHDHLCEIAPARYYDIFDGRARSRVVWNELRAQLRLKDEIPMPTTFEGKKMSERLQIFVSRFSLYMKVKKEKDPASDLATEIEKILNKDPATIREFVSYLSHNHYVFDKEEAEKISSYVDSLSPAERDKLNRNTKAILGAIIKMLKKKTLSTLNAGSPSIPAGDNGSRNFMIYEIDSSDIGVTFVHKTFTWGTPYRNQFNPTQSVDVAEIQLTPALPLPDVEIVEIEKTAQVIIKVTGDYFSNIKGTIINRSKVKKSFNSQGGKKKKPKKK